MLVPDRDFRREPVNSVSGGVGGREAFFELEDLRSEGVGSAGFGFWSDPRSVWSGVSGSDFLATSSGLWKASLLCALLKDEYGLEMRSVMLNVDAPSSASGSVSDEPLSFPSSSVGRR